MSYRKLEIWQIANELVINIHKMTLEELPSFEMYEEGNQIRRSSKSVKPLIIEEGYGRRVYKKDFIKFLINALASNDETFDHLENLYSTGSLKNKEIFKKLKYLIITLGKKINKFIQAVQVKHNELQEPEIEYIRNIQIE